MLTGKTSKERRRQQRKLPNKNRSIVQMTTKSCEKGVGRMPMVPFFGKKQRRAFICCLDSNDNETKTKERQHQWFLLLFVGDQIFLSQKRRSTEAEGGAWSLASPIFLKMGQSIAKKARQTSKSKLFDGSA